MEKTEHSPTVAIMLKNNIGELDNCLLKSRSTAIKIHIIPQSAFNPDHNSGILASVGINKVRFRVNLNKLDTMTIPKMIISIFILEFKYGMIRKKVPSSIRIGEFLDQCSSQFIPPADANVLYRHILPNKISPSRADLNSPSPVPV